MIKLVRTVVVPSIELSEEKFKILKELEEYYKSMLIELINFGSSNNIKSFTGLKKYKYRELRKKYSQLPSHYIHVVCQDASTRIKSFMKLKKRGLVGTERPVIRNVSIWLDDHLWKFVNYTAIKVATHRGWISIEFRPHKLFWKYMNSGWRLRTQTKIKLNQKKRITYIYFTFEKEVNIAEDRQIANVVAVDVNENNVTIKAGGKAFVLQTDIKKLTIGYFSYREAIQSIKGSKYARRTVHGRERSRKRDRRYKIANLIVNTAKQLNATVVVEDLPKHCPKNMISSVRDKKLRHRIYQAGFRSVVNVIEEKCLEKKVQIARVNPKHTSSQCPFCGMKLVRGDAPRHLKCRRCGIQMGRDVIAVLNIEKKYLTTQGPVPLAPMPYDPTLEVAVLPVKVWVRRKSLDKTLINPEMKGMKI